MPPHKPQYPTTDGKGIPIRLKRIALIPYFILVAMAGLFSGCIDGHEEYWLNQDGSGRAEIHYTIPSSIALMEGGEAGIRKIVEDFLKSIPDFTDSSCEVVTETSVTRVLVRVSFDSALKLAKITSGSEIHNLPTAARHLAGDIKTELHGRTLELTRTASPAKAIPGAFLMPASSFEANHLVYIIHLPVPVSESNATRVTDDGRTLSWDIPLADTLSYPVITRFKMKIPLPWKPLCAFAFSLFLLSGFAFSRVKKARQCRKTSNSFVAVPPAS